MDRLFSGATSWFIMGLGEGAFPENPNCCGWDSLGFRREHLRLPDASMGELDSRVSKLLLSESWPFSLDCWRLIKTRLFPESPGAENFSRILTEVSQKNKPYLQYLQGLGVTAPLPIDDNLREAEAETKRLRDLAEIVFQKEAQKARMEPQSEERTKAILAERVELKKRLRELGYKVNDDVVDNSDLEESEP